MKMEMQLIDWMILLGCLSAAIGGYRIGFVARVASWVGIVGGVTAAVWLLPTILRNASGISEASRPRQRPGGSIPNLCDPFGIADSRRRSGTAGSHFPICPIPEGSQRAPTFSKSFDRVGALHHLLTYFMRSSVQR